MESLAVWAGRWNATNARARMAIGAAALLAILAAAGYGIVLHPARGPLFSSPLYPGQLAEVEEQLAAWNVAFTPIDRNVVVADGRRSTLLLRLALAGLPHAHVADSTEALAGIGVLTPQSVVDAQTRVGLAGDIERALRGMRGVRDARVIIAPARRASFADESAAPATASVRIRSIDGMQIDADEARGIRRFVAASVPELQPQRVTLLDDRGNAFDALAEAGSAGGARLERMLQGALDRAFGAGSTIVRVVDERDPSRRTIATLTRAPYGGGALNESTTSESYRKGGLGYDRSSARRERGLAQRRVRESVPAGALRRRDVAVLVDARRVADLGAIRTLVRAAAGIDTHRGDRLVVEALPFTRARHRSRDGWWLAYGAIVPLLPSVLGIVALLFALRALRAPMRWAARIALRALRRRPGAREIGGYAPMQLRGALRDEPPHAAAAMMSALPASTVAAVLELYPPEERAAILRNMARTRSPLVPSADEFF